MHVADNRLDAAAGTEVAKALATNSTLQQLDLGGE